MKLFFEMDFDDIERIVDLLRGIDSPEAHRAADFVHNAGTESLKENRESLVAVGRDFRRLGEESERQRRENEKSRPRELTLEERRREAAEYFLNRHKRQEEAAASTDTASDEPHQAEEQPKRRRSKGDKPQE